MKRKILLLEDDPNLGLILQEHLGLNGFDVTLCIDGEEGAEQVARQQFELCLVDVMMPRKDGFTFVRELRQKDSQTPVIFLTAKSLKEDRITGFKVGCDDYITKPFSVEELLLRIEAVLRRSGSASPGDTPTSFDIGSYHFDSRTRLLSRHDDKRKLTGKEAELLQLLCCRVNTTLNREEALREIWSDEGYFSGRSMDVFISRLRKYLKDDPAVEILSVHGKGFRLSVNI